MPLFEFSCPNCGNNFEQIAKFDESNFVCCPTCGAKARKRFSTFVVQGLFRHFSQGKPDKVVFYPDGKSRTVTWNEKYEDGGV